MLSLASKGHNPIAMMCYNFRVILNCTKTSSTLCFYRNDVTYQFVISSVVNKHLLLARGMVLGNKKRIVSNG